ncbi:MAG TPA: hypothetical protein VGM54_26015 [Chthoniobacter sp.]
MNDHDPLCSCIEACLKELEEAGAELLRRRTEGAEVHLSFGAHSLRAITYDTALVRLAMVMLDDRRYGRAMRRALDSQIEAEN